MNYSVQLAIAAFVDSLRPSAEADHATYYGILDSFAAMQSQLLTMFGYPPVD
ncbi:MAG: hypothetical protein ACRCSF_11285 [Mycobacteriaceae bacterium]